MTIQELMSRAHENSAELSFHQLFEVFELPKEMPTLDKVRELEAQLEAWNLVTHPDIRSRN